MKKNYVAPALFCEEYRIESNIAAQSPGGGVVDGDSGLTALASAPRSFSPFKMFGGSPFADIAPSPTEGGTDLTTEVIQEATDILE